MQEGTIPMFEPNFFREIEHPHVKNNNFLQSNEKKLVRWEMIESDEKSYWERRKRRDWDGLPDLWGPF